MWTEGTFRESMWTEGTSREGMYEGTCTEGTEYLDKGYVYNSNLYNIKMFVIGTSRTWGICLGVHRVTYPYRNIYIELHLTALKFFKLPCTAICKKSCFFCASG